MLAVCRGWLEKNGGARTREAEGKVSGTPGESRKGGRRGVKERKAAAIKWERERERKRGRGKGGRRDNSTAKYR